MGDVPETISATEDGPDLPVTEVLTGRAFLTGKSGSGKSILEGTPVYTERGRKPIEDVEEGERVLSLDRHTYKQEFREVQATIRHTDDRLIRITLEDGTELVGTEDHSFLTAGGMEIVPVRGDEIEPGTWVPLSRQLPEVESTDRIDLGEYVGEANTVYVDGDQVTSAGRTEDRFLDLDFESGKVVGLYLAEGSFDSGGTLNISNIDEDIHEFLGSWGFNVYERMCSMGFQPFARFLESQFGAGSGGKSIPNWAFGAPAAFRAGVISGYFDGDGTVGDNDVTVMSKSPDLLDGIKELLRQFGISSTIRDKFVLYGGERRRYRRLRVDSFAIDAFAELVDLSVTEKSASLADVRDRLDAGEGYNSKDTIPNFGPVLNAAARERGWTERDSEKRVRGASVHHLTRKQKAGRETYNALVDELGIEGRARAYGESDIQWKRVASVEELDEERTVYDLDVRGNDNFVANGVFVHNSNSASVVAEELLDAGLSLLIVDTDGEYYGLKEEFEILHVGGDETCDVRVGAEHAPKLAELALENVPIILDVSGYAESEGRDLVAAVARELFDREKTARQPFLMVVEEVHEYLPQERGFDDAGEALVRVAKRGRKRGLGLAGISQRPAAVDKDFITQCDWLVWHRLTWDNDTRVVANLHGSDAAETVRELDDGEALLVTDWDDEVRRVRFRRKRTFDAGATPTLGEVDRPELKSVGSELVAELRAATGDEDGNAGDDGTSAGDDSGSDAGTKTKTEAEAEAEVEELRAKLDRKDERIEELEARIAELESRNRQRKRNRDAPEDEDEDTSREPPDHFWELGQLMAYLVGSVVRGVVGVGRRLTGDTRE